MQQRQHQRCEFVAHGKARKLNTDIFVCAGDLKRWGAVLTVRAFFTKHLNRHQIRQVRNLVDQFKGVPTGRAFIQMGNKRNRCFKVPQICFQLFL